MSADRLKALKRIRTVQAQVKRLAEARLAAAERSKRDLGEAFGSLGAFLDEACPTGDLAGLAIRSKRRVARREAEAETDRARHAEALVAAQTRLTLTERRLDDLDLEARRAAERRDLERLLEAYLARPRDAVEAKD